MLTLDEKIKELEKITKEQLKAKKAKLMAQYREKEKKEKLLKDKALFAKILQYQKLMKHDDRHNDILLGSIIRGFEVFKSKDEIKINQLIELAKK